MLRRFSIKRIFGFFLVDWLGSIAILVWASLLRVDLGNLPAWLVDRLQTLQITVGSEGQIVSGNYIYKLSVLVLVAIIWPIFFLLSPYTTASVIQTRLQNCETCSLPPAFRQ